jgi:hypothetical protein
MCRIAETWVLVILLGGMSIQAGLGQAPKPTLSPYSKWARGPSSKPGFFPLAVWLQNPVNAQRYKEAGFNTYVALWRGPTQTQLDALRKAGIGVICEQNSEALHHIDDPIIIGWMHGDEPDNAQALKDKSGWGPPVPPEQIVQSYKKLQAADPSRPVMLNLGQGVAWDEWYGRGSRKNRPEDYPKYIEGCDIASFDIYPAVHDRKEIAGNLWYVPLGVERLKRWAGESRVVWNCLECTHISNPDIKPTSRQVRSEAWMSLIKGSQGLIFFVHQFKPEFREAALLDDPEMLAAVSSLNRQITELAPVLNEAPILGEVTIQAVPSSGSVEATLKRHAGVEYIFAAETRGQATDAEFHLKDGKDHKVEVLGEGRTLAVGEGRFKDNFGPWDVHLYRVQE